jgi:hypothetical protein
VAKKGYASKEEAQKVADERNLMAANSPYGMLPRYESYQYHDPVTGENKWLVREKRQSRR